MIGTRAWMQAVRRREWHVHSGLLGVLVMGDDVTDVDMFGAVAHLRAAGSLRAAIIGVGGVDRDAPPAVVEAADAMLREPAEAARLLTALAEVA